MTKGCLAICALAVAALSTACTIRYSQSVTGSVPTASGSPVESSETGFSFLQITFQEPRPAHEQIATLMGRCRELRHVEVDYRELSFILFGIPRVSVRGTCVQ